MPTASKSKAVASFELLSENTALSSRRSSTDPTKIHHIRGDLARLSDGRLMSRTRSVDKAGNQLLSYGLYDPDQNRVEIGAAPDPVAALDRIADHLEQKQGLLTLSHRPEPGPEDRFIADYGPLGAAILEKLNLAPQVMPTFLFGPGLTRYPNQGIAGGAARVRELFFRHAVGNYGDSQFNATPLTIEERWCLGMLTAARQSDHAIQTGRGIVRSLHGDIELVSVLSPSRHTTLIFDRSRVEV